MSSPSPGWYQDPTNPDQQKWWDGQNWSTHTMPLAGTYSPGSDQPTAGERDGEPHGAETAAVPQAPAFPGADAGAEDYPSYPGNQGYPGGQQQAYPSFQAPAQPQSYADASAADVQQGYHNYQGYPQGYGAPQAGYSGYPGYQSYPGYPQKPLRSNPLALTGFILGIVSFFMFFIPFVGTVISLAAGAFSAIGLSNQRDRAPMYKVFGIIGLVLGIIFTLLSVLILALIFSDPSSY